MGSTYTYLSLVRLVGSAVVKDSVTLPTQIATLLTKDEGLSLTVIMVVTQGLEEGQNEWVV